MNANFIDYVKSPAVQVREGPVLPISAGRKYIPKGGPDGGDGGRGGHVIVIGNRNLWTLLHLRYTRHVIAQGQAEVVASSRVPELPERMPSLKYLWAP
jgi:GTPase